MIRWKKKGTNLLIFLGQATQRKKRIEIIIIIIHLLDMKFRKVI